MGKCRRTDDIEFIYNNYKKVKKMRKHIVAGNWKMNTTVAEGVELAKAVVEASAEVPADVKLIIAPPFTHLYPVVRSYSWLREP